MILILSGPSGVGKSFLCDAAVASGMRFVVPTTTRLKREGETEGRDYRFVGRTVFQEMIAKGELADWDYTVDNYYGTARDDFEPAALSDQAHILHSLSRMAVRYRERHDGVRTVFLMPDDNAVLEERLRSRGIDDHELAMRRAHWEEEVAHANLFDHIVEHADRKPVEDLLAEVLDFAGRGGTTPR